MTFTLTKGYPLHPQGKHDAVIQKVWMEENCDVEVKGKKKQSDLVMIEYITELGKLTQRYFPVMEEDTDLGEVVKAINNDEIPDEINDPEDFFEGKTIGIVVKHNKSNTSGRTFANVAEVYNLNDDDDEELDQEEVDLNESDEEDEDLDLDEEIDEPSDDDESDEELDDDFLEDDPAPKRPKPRRSSNWTSNSYDDDTDDVTD
ncbi:hypothetical protein [Brevibacillus invocatus]|uniref:hypothetical protein n=1 Tax=Brevibacillus invocatus TaxID=173959 RepID=UPI002040EA6B|nr:hypothetical protein [Brevibacillus invocatus]MCM3081928.1 hypothetical protein [Brevibacillus invocatus]MCM3432334.1 hypothetical protein [Brevibacillus invocatus]